MPAKSKGYDPDLNRKFFEDSMGFVIGRANSPQQNSEDADPLAKFQSPQEAHDEQMANRTPCDPPPETEADGRRAGQERLARWRHQNEQLRKKAGAPRDAPPIQPEAKGNEP